MNPASADLMVMDTTSNYLLNNLGVMGYSEITVWNLFSEICLKIKPSMMSDEDFEVNMEYLSEILSKKKFDTILLGYGSGFNGNTKVEERKKRVQEVFEGYEDKVYELVDKDQKYDSLV